MTLQTYCSRKLPVTKSAFTPVHRGLLQRKCACGGTPGPTGECAECRRKRLNQQSSQVESSKPSIPTPAPLHQPSPGHRLGQFTLFSAQRGGGPTKALSTEPEPEPSAKPRPQAGSATIQCDGSGGYEVVLNGWSGAACGTKSCVIAHETSHMDDWKAKWPTGCKDQPKGYLPKGDPPDSPLMTVAEYGAFLRQSECKAHTVDLACAEALPKTGACKKTVEDYIKLTRDQKANYCPSNAVVGAILGLGLGGIAGAAIGATIGATVDALTE